MSEGGARVFPLLIPAHYRLRMERIHLGAEDGSGFPWPPRGLPWPIVAPHAAQALRNHGQSLEELAARGGLDPAELVAVLEDRPWALMPTEAAIERVRYLARARAALGHRGHPPADKTCTCGVGPWCLEPRTGHAARYVPVCGYCYRCGGFDGGPAAPPGGPRRGSGCMTFVIARPPRDPDELWE